MITENGLLPCPFCGCADIDYDNADDANSQWYRCVGCGVRVEGSYQDDLKAMWNRRAGLDTLQTEAYAEGRADEEEEMTEMLIFERKARIDAQEKLEQARSPWRTMDSAPRDGTELLACCTANHVFTAWWESHYSDWATLEDMTNRKITHWMPLPPPPATKETPSVDTGEMQA